MSKRLPPWLRELRADWRRTKAQRGPTRRERLAAIVQTGRAAPVPIRPGDLTGPALTVEPSDAAAMLAVYDCLDEYDGEDWARLDLVRCAAKCVSHLRRQAAAGLVNLIFGPDGDEPPPDDGGPTDEPSLN